MDFKQALKVMKDGKKVKLPSWGGYWDYDTVTDSIYMHTKEGEHIEIRKTERLMYTIENILSDEWIIADEYNTPILGGIATFNFGEAIKYMKRGFKVARKGWNGKGMYIRYVNPYTDKKITVITDGSGEGKLLPYIAMKTSDYTFVPWLASQSDMLAEDWIFFD